MKLAKDYSGLVLAIGWLLVLAGAVMLFSMNGCAHALPRGGFVTTANTSNGTSHTVTTIHYDLVKDPAPTAQQSVTVVPPPPVSKVSPPPAPQGYHFVPAIIITTDAHTTGTANVEARNDDDPKAGMTVHTVDADVRTSGAQTQPKVDAALGGFSASAGWIGACVIGAGVLILVASFVPYVKLILPIPVWIGPVIIGIGIAILASPVLLDRYGWILPLVGCAVALGWAIHEAILHGWFNRATSPAVIANLKASGDDRAAGAVTMIATGDKNAAKIMAMPSTSPPVAPAGGSKPPVISTGNWTGTLCAIAGLSVALHLAT